MKRSAILSAVVLSAILGSGAIFLHAALPAGEAAVGERDIRNPLQQAANDAVGEDAGRAAAAIKALRAAGPAGLDALFTVNAAQITRIMMGANPMNTVPVGADPAGPRLRAAIDAVAMQHDAIASHLYWYTDLEAAKAAAAESGKPILSLRMLGKLNEDLSCANSRFFRTTLYSNATVSAFLRKNFILHWESVRPVPVITIDMGDGRKMVRTITGNSIHYVLDTKGRVVDALPGLYGAATFVKDLKVAAAVAVKFGPADDGEFQTNVRQFASEQLKNLQTDWWNDLKAVGAAPVATGTISIMSGVQMPVFTAATPAGGGPETGIFGVNTTPAAAAGVVVPAPQAMRTTVSKSGVEQPMLVRIMQQPAPVPVNVGPAGSVAATPLPLSVQPTAAGTVTRVKVPVPAPRAMPLAIGKGRVEGPMLAQLMPDAKSLEASSTDEVWTKIAALHRNEAALDQSTQRLIQMKGPPAAQAMPLTRSKSIVETPMMKMVRNLQDSIALDTVKNEYQMHAKIAQWLAASPKPVVLKEFNEKVYADLFLTPSSDPWLGMVPPDTFSALDNEGFCEVTTAAH